MKKIFVIGYPRSGNVWLSRSISDLFDCSISVPRSGRMSIALKKGDSSKFTVIQDHYSTCDINGEKEDVFTQGIYMNPKNKPDDSYLIFLCRNPFDVVASVYKYWKRESIKEALDNMRNSGVTPRYNAYMMGWMDYLSHVDMVISYEQLHYNYEEVLRKIAKDNNYKVDKSIEAIRIYNSLKSMKRRVSESPEDFSYNPDVQLGHLRKGVIGDWINHFTLSDIDYAFDFIGDVICMLGYFPDGCKSKEDVLRVYKENPEQTFDKKIFDKWNI